jgi:two-component system sensor histidine kinase DesK
MTLTMAWLPTVIRVAIAPVLVGVVALLLESQQRPTDLAAAGGLAVLSTIHIVYWWRPWPSRHVRAATAFVAMVAVDFVLINLLGLSEPLLWLYPALIAGAGLRAPVAALAVGLTALAAAAPLALESQLLHPLGAVPPAEALGISHSVLLSIVLAGLGMTAVRQLIAVNTDLEATRAELADAAVARDRERLARELHDLLGRTLSLIAVKAELASRLSSRGDRSGETELADVQRLARQAVRDVREAVTGAHVPSVLAELASAEVALQTAGIKVCIVNLAVSIDPAHESTIAWALREAVTNVVKHSGARTCHIALESTDGSTTLAVNDNGRGPVGDSIGTGLQGLADRVHALGGTLDIGPGDVRGFIVRVRLGAAVPKQLRGVAAQ